MKLHRFPSSIRKFLSISSAFLLLFGCGGAGPEDSTLPAAGAMKLVSVAPVAELGKGVKNLIPNGDFREFMAGAPCPTRFVPPKTENARLTPVRDVDGSSGVLHEWLISDSGSRLVDFFRVHLIGIKPGGEYTLEVDATSVEGSGASVSLYEMQPDGKTEIPLEIDFLRIKPQAGHRETYRKSFKTQAGVRLVVTMHANEDTPVGGKVIWHALVLSENHTQ